MGCHSMLIILQEISKHLLVTFRCQQTSLRVFSPFFYRGCAGLRESLPEARRPCAPPESSSVAPGAGLSVPARKLAGPISSPPLVASKRRVVNMELFIGALYPKLSRLRCLRLSR